MSLLVAVLHEDRPSFCVLGDSSAAVGALLSPRCGAHPGTLITLFDPRAKDDRSVAGVSPEQVISYHGDLKSSTMSFLTKCDVFLLEAHGLASSWDIAQLKDMAARKHLVVASLLWGPALNATDSRVFWKEGGPEVIQILNHDDRVLTGEFRE